MSCLLATADLIAAELDRLAPDCHCEACSGSPYGPVSADEQLIRFLVPPVHWDPKKQKPKATALSAAESKGLSLYRSTYATDDELKEGAELLVGAKRQTDPSAGLIGILLLNASSLKQTFGLPVPPYCLYDTGLPGRPSHADSFQRTHGIPLDQIQARRRALFAVVADGFVKLSDFRNGLLLPWGAANAP